MQDRLAWKLNVPAMNNLHKVYFNIGSNIKPEIHLPQAIKMLHQHGEIQAVSTPWESHAVGGGPNFLNVCVLIETALDFEGMKREIVHAIESALGRVRGMDKNAPRIIDVDIIMIDGQAISLEKWSNPFVIVPMAEIAPDCIHPALQTKMSEAADRALKQTWIQKRSDVVLPFHN